MMVLKALLIFFGCVVGLVVICAVSIWWRRSGSSVESYDERQKIAHGEAFQVALIVGSAYYLLLAILYMLQRDRGSYSVDPYLGIFFGFMLQTMLYHIYCLLTHSALPLHQKPSTPILCCGISGLMQFANGFSRYSKHGVLPSLTGEGTEQSVYLMSGVFLLSLAVIHLIAMLWKEKE